MFERFHPIHEFYYGFSIWIILSTHRFRYRLLWASAASDTSITSSVYSYLRSILTATFFAIFYSFHFICSRDFILSVEWYYGISIWIILSTHRFRYRLSWASAASDTSITSYNILRLFLPSVYSYGHLLRHFYSFFFMCSRDFILSSYYGISIWMYISRNIEYEAQRAIVITSSVYPYSLLFRSALSPASPVHSYGGYARPFSFTFLYTHTITLPFIVSLLSVTGNGSHNHFWLLFLYRFTLIHISLSITLLKDFSILYMMTSWVRMTSYFFLFLHFLHDTSFLSTLQ